MLFPLFLHVDDHWGICCRSRDSTEKMTIKGPYFEDQENSRKMLGNYILPKDSGSQKGESRGARGSLTHRGHGLALGHADPV
jgi:hypothetical protein